MSAADWIVIAVIAVSVVSAVATLIIRKKSGKGCCPDCSGCDVCRNRRGKS